MAIDEACRLGRCSALSHRRFAAGHLRTPVTAIRGFWHHRYPQFWQRLSAKAAQTLREEGFTGRLVIIGDEADDEGITPVQDLIRSEVPVDRHRLSDPAVPLRDSVGCNAG